MVAALVEVVAGLRVSMEPAAMQAAVAVAQAITATLQLTLPVRSSTALTAPAAALTVLQERPLLGRLTAVELEVLTTHRTAAPA